MKKTVVALALITFILTGCSGNPIEKIDGYLKNKEYTEAMEWLADELDDEPESPILNTLAAEVILKECAYTNCFDKNPKKLEALSLHLSKIKETQVVDDTTINLHARIIKVAKWLINSKHHPKALASINFFMPYGNLMQELTLLTFKKASEHIIKGDIPPASTLMNSLSKKIILKNPNQALATLIDGYITNDNDLINKALDNFTKADDSIPLNDDALKALPYAIFQQVIEKNPNNGTQTFLDEFRNILKIANIKYLNSERGRAKIANAVYAMARNNNFLERARLHDLKTNSVSNTKTSNEKIVPNSDNKVKQEYMQKLRLNFTKLALLTNPKNKKSWDIFLEPAKEYAIKTGDAKILFEGLEPGDIPSSIIKEYNKTLFTITEKLVKENKSILEVIQHIILPAEGADVIKNKVAKLLNQAMINAVDTENYDLVYKYASFQPDIARLSRQKVVSITIDALEKKWKYNEFEGMDKLAEFLYKTMGIDFSLDSLLLQSFDDYLTQTGVQKQLNADSSEDLLKPANEVKIDLGDKFKFLQQHFAKKPEVLDNLLKSLIVKSEGIYGIPVALHKLSSYFSDKFPAKDRKAYLINAIKNSLIKDDKTKALEFALQGQKLQEKYPEIAKSFIVDETMKRISGLEDSKNLWKNISKDFKNLVKDVKPQFATLMHAITAYENGDREKAASLFTILSDPKLIEQARPYLQEYVETVHAQVGAYILDKNQCPNIKTKMLYVDLIKQDKKNESKQDKNKDKNRKQSDLLAVKISLVSKLGSITTHSSEDLTVDMGKIARYDIIGRINPNTMEIIIPEDQKSGKNLPLSFEKIFGNLNQLNLEGDRIIYATDKHNCNFKRINGYHTNKPNFIDGKYSILSGNKGNDPRSNHIMPIGSIIEVKTSKNRTIKNNNKRNDVIYPIKGVVHHPSSIKPRPFNGFFNPKTQAISFSYNYPLISGGSLDAVIRCQIIGANITCAGHNKHWGRKRYSHIVEGKKIFVKDDVKASKINRVKSRSKANK